MIYESNFVLRETEDHVPIVLPLTPEAATAFARLRVQCGRAIQAAYAHAQELPSLPQAGLESWVRQNLGSLDPHLKDSCGILTPAVFDATWRLLHWMVALRHAGEQIPWTVGELRNGIVTLTTAADYDARSALGRLADYAANLFDTYATLHNVPQIDPSGSFSDARSGCGLKLAAIGAGEMPTTVTPPPVPVDPGSSALPVASSWWKWALAAVAIGVGVGLWNKHRQSVLPVSDLLEMVND